MSLPERIENHEVLILLHTPGISNTYARKGVAGDRLSARGIKAALRGSRTIRISASFYHPLSINIILIIKS